MKGDKSLFFMTLAIICMWLVLDEFLGKKRISGWISSLMGGSSSGASYEVSGGGVVVDNGDGTSTVYGPNKGIVYTKGNGTSSGGSEDKKKTNLEWKNKGLYYVTNPEPNIYYVERMINGKSVKATTDYSSWNQAFNKAQGLNSGNDRTSGKGSQAMNGLLKDPLYGRNESTNAIKENLDYLKGLF